MNRRSFLKSCGVAVAGLAGVGAVKAEDFRPKEWPQIERLANREPKIDWRSLFGDKNLYAMMKDLHPENCI